ncbi:MAG TPA: hypothetical protein VHG52_03945, partial [Thermomicrobiales bacterium]|nr:hypothetical protein [Thermomicrobiales bacterium]
PGESPFDIHSWLISRYALSSDRGLTGARVTGPQQVPLPATGLPGLDFALPASLAGNQPR